MSVITFRCHTTVYVPVLEKTVNTMTPESNGLLMSGINVSIRKAQDRAERKSLLELYRIGKLPSSNWKEKKKSGLLLDAGDVMEMAENKTYRMEQLRELEGAWSIGHKMTHTFFVFHPALTTIQIAKDSGKYYLVCEDEEYGLIDLAELNDSLMELLKKFMGVKILTEQEMKPGYRFTTNKDTGISSLKIEGEEKKGTWLLVSDEKKEDRLKKLSGIYRATYPALVSSNETALWMAKEETAGQCFRTEHGILEIERDGLEYLDEKNPDISWRLEYPVYENASYPAFYGEACRKLAKGEAESRKNWEKWLDIHQK